MPSPALLPHPRPEGLPCLGFYQATPGRSLPLLTVQTSRPPLARGGCGSEAPSRSPTRLNLQTEALLDSFEIPRAWPSVQMLTRADGRRC